ncbi:TIGR03943 family putative permease subunit [Actinomyces marmotae]|uniref:TIGR03943 family putative permease subunit n=1 Tax=Actinomyces marmotae TaxID=2737173 RepID=UPI001358D603|nr:TIGR03943 family protein [Actinomyces marmotae]
MSDPAADRAQAPTPLSPRPVENCVETGCAPAPGGGEEAARGPGPGGAASRAGEAAGAVIVLVLGLLLGALVLTGRSHHYVQPLLTPALGLTAALLLALAAWSLWALCGSRRRGCGAHRPRAASWLLLLPAVLAAASPAPLGSALLASTAVGGGRAAAAHGEAGGAVAVDVWTGERIDLAARAARRGTALPALDPGADNPLTLAEFGQYWDSARRGELLGERVTVIGFAAPDGEGGWVLGRFQIICCAADAVPYQVGLRAGGGPVPGADVGGLRADRWYEVVGTVVGAAGGPAIDVERLREIPQPKEPYL